MRIAAALAVALAIAFAVMQRDASGPQGEGPQGRAPRMAADAGVPRRRPAGPVLLGTDPPGKLRPSPPSDAGVAGIDAGPTAVEREVQQLRARVDALERERGQVQQQSQQLDEVVRQLQQLRTQIADSEAQKKAADQQQAARREQVQSGVNALYQAQSMLASGNSAVDDQLAQAQAGFPPQAQRDLAAARAALQNHDLSAARAYVSAAIADAQQER